MERKYLPTLSDLIDRLTIVQQKAIFISEKRDEYVREMELIMHDVDLILAGLQRPLGARELRAVIVIMLANRFIWENESLARLGGPEHDKRLKLTHSINGVRNTAKNILAEADGGRHDHKIDCFAAELVQDFGNWNVFGDDASSRRSDRRMRRETDAEYRNRFLVMMEKAAGPNARVAQAALTATGAELDAVLGREYSLPREVVAQ